MKNPLSPSSLDYIRLIQASEDLLRLSGTKPEAAKIHLLLRAFKARAKAFYQDSTVTDKREEILLCLEELAADWIRLYDRDELFRSASCGDILINVYRYGIQKQGFPATVETPEPQADPQEVPQATEAPGEDPRRTRAKKMLEDLKKAELFSDTEWMEQNKPQQNPTNLNPNQTLF